MIATARELLQAEMTMVFGPRALKEIDRRLPESA